MPCSVRTVDATSMRCDSEDDSPMLIRRRSPIQQTEIRLPPYLIGGETTMREESQGGSPSATAREGRRITRSMDRGAPDDQAMISGRKTLEKQELAKKRSQYYSEAFACRQSNTSARERITKESMIVADVRTNVIVHDEYTVTTDLSYYLSQRYQRPENSIVVTLTHSLCLLFGGTFDPAYTLSITALPSQLQPVTNKRNAALLATHMQESLSVNPRRGVINFVAIPEENLANDSITVSGEIEDLEKEMSENGSLQRSLSRGRMKTRRQSMRSLRGAKNSPMPTHEEALPSTPIVNQSNVPPMPAYPIEKSDWNRKVEKAQKKIGRRKSFIATIFGKAG
ncbi:uncharacterized protein RSE6_14348 [Rhynchosporium secalis]|uniref:L-dopachrome isomerase n=1 Tax=Rhynchosporium secalis TaxID=38038 RepID=A0A1E1MV30_RHYSE|nr:uncharacterized protein RSE6_14348 [Rhynchosporium secalis]